VFIQTIDRWTTIGAWNCNRGNELDCDREDEDSQLLERLRNLGIMLSEDECMGLTAREAEEL
jgi:hypothetical protein